MTPYMFCVLLYACVCECKFYDFHVVYSFKWSPIISLALCLQWAQHERKTISGKRLAWALNTYKTKLFCFVSFRMNNVWWRIILFFFLNSSFFFAVDTCLTSPYEYVSSAACICVFCTNFHTQQLKREKIEWLVPWENHWWRCHLSLSLCIRARIICVRSLMFLVTRHHLKRKYETKNKLWP